ncbi:GGDEF domain-containing protein [Metasolibacillus meyeri]|uniref:GGDEF domain-containing protein n=1 Tax=Metasolibacillus meyeri TaxID=1071052 RepID=UPI000D3211E8|nr:GGDEF domain-containing protein [Metasolibacillus meyeri]
MKNLHIKLFLSLIIFAIILVTVVTQTNRKLIQNDIQERAKVNWSLIENQILDNLETIDIVQHQLEQELSKTVEKELRQMAELYKENPNILSWDLEQMKSEHGMEIYILDDTNTIIHTTYRTDLGISFKDCCAEFDRVLTQRRQSGEFFTEGIDISTQTNEMWKYSYLATPDHKYLMEIGIPAKEIALFNNFNFVDIATKLPQEYDDLLEVKIMSRAGKYLSGSNGERGSVKDSDADFQAAFQRALETSNIVQYDKQMGEGVIETYRFLPYDNVQNRSYSTKRIVFLKYNNATELAWLKVNTQQFYFILGVAMLTSLIALVALNLILMKTVRQAERDPLTGVYNRATYLEQVEKLLRRTQQKKIGLLLFDVDNFKQVNDRYGHIKGDMVLVELAKMLEQLARKEGLVVRFGGDEFAIVVKDATVDKLERIANEAIRDVRQRREGSDLAWQLLSLSIGGTLQTDLQETERDLYSRADEALYASKNAGKDRYSLKEL